MDIIESIKKRSTELTRKQYMVAKYMIDHPDEMAYITLKELSRDIGVTEITILNTCASLGYESFTQIKYEFRKDIIPVSYTHLDVYKRQVFLLSTAPKANKAEKIYLFLYMRNVGKEFYTYENRM